LTPYGVRNAWNFRAPPQFQQGDFPVDNFWISAVTETLLQVSRAWGGEERRGRMEKIRNFFRGRGSSRQERRGAEKCREKILLKNIQVELTNGVIFKFSEERETAVFDPLPDTCVCSAPLDIVFRKYQEERMKEGEEREGTVREEKQVKRRRVEGRRGQYLV
jgi:hypothetical protein